MYCRPSSAVSRASANCRAVDADASADPAALYRSDASASACRTTGG
jgi:hypothetical protein